VGFLAKYGVFVTAFKSGFVLPAVIALLGALIGYYAYWKPVALLYQVSESRPALPLPVLSVSVLLLILVGALPVLLWGWMDHLYGVAGYFGR
jgi:NADH:ubiquinone oxidoreductase subunit 2 (subunit N)